MYVVWDLAKRRERFPVSTHKINIILPHMISRILLIMHRKLAHDDGMQYATSNVPKKRRVFRNLHKLYSSRFSAVESGSYRTNRKEGGRDDRGVSKQFHR